MWIFAKAGDNTRGGMEKVKTTRDARKIQPHKARVGPVSNGMEKCDKERREEGMPQQERFPWHLHRKSVGRKVSRIKAVCRDAPATAQNCGRRRPSAVRTGVTIWEKCYELYAKVGDNEESPMLFP